MVVDVYLGQNPEQLLSRIVGQVHLPKDEMVLTSRLLPNLQYMHHAHA